MNGTINLNQEDLKKPNLQKGQNPGIGLYMEFYELLKCRANFRSRYEKSGFYLKFQDPYSISPYLGRKFHLLMGSHPHFKIIPKIFKVDDSIKGDDVKK